MKLPTEIEAAIQEVEKWAVLLGGQQAGSPRLRRLRSAIETQLREQAESLAAKDREVEQLRLGGAPVGECDICKRELRRNHRVVLNNETSGA